MVILRNGHTLIDGKHFICYTGDVQLDRLYCLIGMFSDHEPNTSKTTMTNRSSQH